MAKPSQDIRYEPDEPCPLGVSLGVGFQGVILSLGPAMLVAITFRAAGQDDRYVTWAVFATLIISGAVTALQAGRVGWFGGHHIHISSAAPYFFAISLTALAAGGPVMLASLVVVASLVQFALAAWLPLLRRIVTPVVSGTVIMLLASAVMPVATGRLKEVPGDVPRIAILSVALATLLVATLLALRASGAWRIWSLLIGIVVGSSVAASWGLFDVSPLVAAPWVGIPEIAWPGFDLSPDKEFWALLPLFIVVTLVSTIKTIGDGVTIQRVSRRQPRVTDFRLVQGGVNANGVGTLLAGVAGTLPPIILAANTVSLINFTGVASRRVGYVIGIFYVALALMPKVAALLLAIPSPVIGTYLLMIMGLLFVEGMRTVVQDGLDQRKVVTVGTAFAIGLGLQNQDIFTDLAGPTWNSLLINGITTGALVAIFMTLFLELSSPRRQRLQVQLGIAAWPEIDEFLHKLAANMNWNQMGTDRLRASGEELLSSLLQLSGTHTAASESRLIVTAQPSDGSVTLEFLAVFDEGNLEDQLAFLPEQAEIPEESEISFRLLRHYASSVRHRKYHGIDIVTVQVEGSR